MEKKSFTLEMLYSSLGMDVMEARIDWCANFGKMPTIVILPIKHRLKYREYTHIHEMKIYWAKIEGVDFAWQLESLLDVD